jgi:hypothetical protein
LLAQQHVQQLVVGAQLLDEGFHRATHDAAVGAGGAVARLADDLSQRAAGQVDQRHRQFVHVAELAVEAVRRDAGFTRHFTQAERGHAAVRAHQLQRRGQQILARNRGLAAWAVVIVGQRVRMQCHAGGPGIRGGRGIIAG